MRLLALFIVIFLPTTLIGPSKALAITCSDFISILTEKNDEILATALARSTPEIVGLLDPASDFPKKWVTIELVQDRSHEGSLPRFPPLVLTTAGQKSFDENVLIYMADGRARKELPKLKKMYFSNKPEEFNGVAAALTSHTIIQVKVQDLMSIVLWFTKTSYRPALGNKLFKIALVDES